MQKKENKQCDFIENGISKIYTKQYDYYSYTYKYIFIYDYCCCYDYYHDYDYYYYYIVYYTYSITFSVIGLRSIYLISLTSRRYFIKKFTDIIK